MNKNKATLLVVSAVVIAGGVGYTLMQRTSEKAGDTAVTQRPSLATAMASPAPSPCDASVDWVSNPTLPPEIPQDGPTLCQFHQFAWQSFIALMSMTGDTRAFQNEANYPLLQANGVNSCTTTGAKSRLFVRTLKDKDNPNDDFALPGSVQQAGSGATIYDQNGNAVFYEVRFDRQQCSLDPNQAQFPWGTTEMKVSYRVITEADKPNYIWINGDINGDGVTEPNELLGMVGFHLVKSTPLHPEFVWATFEHKQNVPECQSTPGPNPPAWSFTSVACAAQLPNSVNPTLCNFNTAFATSTPVISGGTPTQICRVYHDGSAPLDNQYSTNVANIDLLNAQLVGPNGFITALPDSNPLAVLENYMLVGALWESDPSQASSVLGNQRGSIQLANSTMETTFQQVDSNSNPLPYTGTSNLQPGQNCFSCHNYTPNNNTGVSFTFPMIHGGSQKK